MPSFDNVAFIVDGIVFQNFDYLPDFPFFGITFVCQYFSFLSELKLCGFQISIGKLKRKREFESHYWESCRHSNWLTSKFTRSKIRLLFGQQFQELPS